MPALVDLARISREDRSELASIQKFWSNMLAYTLFVSLGC